MIVSIDEYKSFTNAMANSLSEIDPNTQNEAEGKAFIKRMYKLRGESADETEPLFPETSD